jgi:hypothetical protein
MEYPPGRTNNLYKEKMVIEPSVEIKEIPDETSQGCKFARTAGYGTLEFCSMPSDNVPVPPRLFQLDEKVDEARIIHKNKSMGITNTQLRDFALALVFLIIVLKLLQPRA